MRQCVVQQVMAAPHRELCTLAAAVVDGDQHEKSEYVLRTVFGHFRVAGPQPTTWRM